MAKNEGGKGVCKLGYAKNLVPGTSLEGLVGQAFCDKRLGQLQVYIEIALLVIKYRSESPQQIT